MVSNTWAASGSWMPEFEVLQFDWLDSWMGDGEISELQMLDALAQIIPKSSKSIVAFCQQL